MAQNNALDVEKKGFPHWNVPTFHFCQRVKNKLHPLCEAKFGQFLFYPLQSISASKTFHILQSLQEDSQWLSRKTLNEESCPEAGNAILIHICDSDANSVLCFDALFDWTFYLSTSLPVIMSNHSFNTALSSSLKNAVLSIQFKHISSSLTMTEPVHSDVHSHSRISS